MLAAGNRDTREQFAAGRAAVSIVITRNVPGDFHKGLKVLEQKLVTTVNAAQASGTKYDVMIGPADELRFQAAAEVRGPE
jgi:hypothetical protein